MTWNTTPRKIRVMSQNMHQPVAGTFEALRSAVETVEPDLLLLQHVEEITSELQFIKLGHLLGLEMAIGPIGGGGSNIVAWHPGVFDKLEVVAAEAQRLEEGFGYCAVQLSVSDIRYPHPLLAISCALSRYSAQRAAQQAQQLGELAHRSGGLGLIAGGINHLPLGDEPPDWDGLPAYRRIALCRLRYSDSEPWTGDDQVTRVLAAGGMTDVAARVADRANADRAAGLEITDHPELRAPTVKDPRGIRTDQIHVTSALTTAIETCWRPKGAVSGHHAIAAELDLAKININGLHAYV